MSPGAGSRSGVVGLLLPVGPTPGVAPSGFEWIDCRLAPGTRQVNGTGRVLLDSANSADSASPSWTRAESAESKLRKKSLKNHKKTHKSHENCAFRDFFFYGKKKKNDFFTYP